MESIFGPAPALPKFSAPTTEARDRAIPAEVQAKAAAARVYLDPGDELDHGPLNGAFLRCGLCGQAVVRLALGHPEDSIKLPTSVEEITSLNLLHQMTVHRKIIDPEWSGNADA